ncbi:hypothetical protein JCM3770_002907 [Rhodotorula araucariae]
MSSSSELEVLPSVRSSKPTASLPEPRRSGRDRRAPRGVDELAAPAVGKGRLRAKRDRDPFDGDAHLPQRDDSDDDGGGETAPPPPRAMKPLAQRRAPRSASAASAQTEPLPSVPVAAPALPAAPVSSSLTRPAALAPPKPQTGTSLRRSRTPAADPIADAPATAVAPASKPTPRTKLPPQTSYSSDEADDFFGRPVPPKGRAPKVAGGGGGTAARLPNRASSGSATPRPASPGRRAPPQTLNLSSTASDSDSSSAPRRGGGGSGGVLLSSDSDAGPASKALRLPEWARVGAGGGAGVSGADRQRAANGVGRNRKRKRLGESGSESEPEGRGERESDAGAKDKGKGRAMDHGGLLETSGDETDDSLELALTGGSKPRTLASARKRKAAIASSSPTPPPQRRPSPHKRLHGGRLPARTDFAPPPFPVLSPHRSPRRALPAYSPQKDAHASHLTLSSDPAQADHGAGVGGGGFGAGGDDDDDPPLDDTLAAIRSRLALARSGHVPAGPVVPGSSPAKAGDADADVGKVTIRLRMVFDPTRDVPEVAKRAYEKEEVFELGVHEPFATLFYELSVRRTIPRDDLVITHVRPGLAGRGRETRLYEFGTPASLSLAAGDDAQVHGYTAPVWDKVRASAAITKAAARVGRDEDDGDDDAELEIAAAAAAAARGRRTVTLDDDSDGYGSADGDAENEPAGAARDRGPGAGSSFPLTLRGSRTQSLSLAVKLSTSMAQLVKAYCRQFGIADAARQARMWIEFDGDRLDGAMTLAEAKDELDLDGEETFEVKEPA